MRLMIMGLKTDKSGSIIFLLAVCLVAALGGLLFGYDTAVISGGIGFLQSHFDLNAAEKGWAASSALVGCVLGEGAPYLWQRSCFW